MDPFTLIVGIPFWGGIAYATWLWWTKAERRTRRVLRRTRVTPIAELVDGQLACVVGTVELEGLELLTSMISKRTCVAYDIQVYFFEGRSAGVPAKVEVERRIVPFYVRDATGVVRVDAAQAALANRPVAKSDRYEERLIDPGAKIRIVGSVNLEPAADGGGARERHYREATRTKATLTGTAKFPILIDTER